MCVLCTTGQFRNACVIEYEAVCKFVIVDTDSANLYMC